jgi:hypothetical protein
MLRRDWHLCRRLDSPAAESTGYGVKQTGPALISDGMRRLLDGRQRRRPLCIGKQIG